MVEAEMKEIEMREGWNFGSTTSHEIVRVFGTIA
jgi:hypothetical protein